MSSSPKERLWLGKNGCDAKMFGGSFGRLRDGPELIVEEHLVNIRVSGGGENPATFAFGWLAVAGYVLAVIYGNFGHVVVSLGWRASRLI